MGSLGKELFPIYYRKVSKLEKKHPFSSTPKDGLDIYNLSFNLDHEFRNLPEGSIVYDVGASLGGATEGMAGKYPNCRFFAITPFLIGKARRGVTKTIPYLEGTVESLPSEIKKRLEKRNGYPPQVIILRNVLRRVYQGTNDGSASGLLSLALIGIHDALPIGGTGLIYDLDGKATYSVYQKYIQQLGLYFTTEQLPNKIPGNLNTCSAYLRLQKLPSLL